MELIFATNNRHKLDEVQQILGTGFRLLTPADCGITEEIPEEEPTLEGNALQKARYIHQRTGKSCFADDTGLEVEALGGQPGVRSARYAGEPQDSEKNMALLLANLVGHPNRRAQFRTVIALILNGEEYLFEGIVRGTIRQQASGIGGFGYDPVFEPEGYNVTFAEMDPATKNAISHRGRATAQMVEFLNETATVSASDCS
ncbi:MAG: RdgB/HAM1 family non-canonical purine NTP pyrophosphatase [Rikenellaceae bacterium]|jgi:XTP/dITP diphosphohydrolase|nr:RdgB/HAM1 family non-canonical purine NTP pyrophosphatase [Rikenellaceae bacterium]